MDRRTFLESIVVTVAGVAALDSIGSLLVVPDAQARRFGVVKDVREIPINLIDNPDLKPIGGTYNLEFDDLDRNILVVHVNPKLFVGVDIKCTHRACEVNYDADHTRFYCPCHGAQYDIYGRVIQGPATKNLNYYHAELQGDEVMVTLYGEDDPVPANCVPPPADRTKAAPADTSERP